jgi:hypothetical protein
MKSTRGSLRGATVQPARPAPAEELADSDSAPAPGSSHPRTGQSHDLNAPMLAGFLSSKYRAPATFAFSKSPLRLLSRSPRFSSFEPNRTVPYAPPQFFHATDDRRRPRAYQARLAVRVDLKGTVIFERACESDSGSDHPRMRT